MSAPAWKIEKRAQCGICDGGEDELHRYCLCEIWTHPECASSVLSKEEFCSDCGYTYRKRYHSILQYFDFVVVFRILWILALFLLWMFDRTFPLAITLGAYFVIQELYRSNGKSITEDDDLTTFLMFLGLNSDFGIGVIHRIITRFNDTATLMSLGALNYYAAELAPISAKTINLFGMTWYW